MYTCTFVHRHIQICIYIIRRNIKIDTNISANININMSKSLYRLFPLFATKCVAMNEEQKLQ